MQTRELIDQLRKDAKPVKCLGCPRKRFAKWLVLSLAYLGFGVWWTGVRPNFFLVSGQFWFWLDSGLLLSLVALAGFFAVWLSIPGLDRSSGHRRVAWVAFGTWAGLTLVRLAVAWFHEDASAFEPHLEGGCIRSLVIFGTPPAVLLVWMQRKGLALQEKWAGTLGILAAAACGALGIQFTCGSCSLFHLLLTHILPVVVIGMLAGPLIGKWVLDSRI